MGQTKVASAAPAAPAPTSTSAIPAPRKADVAETSRAVVAKAEVKADVPVEAKAERRAEPWPAAYAQPRNDFPAPLPAQPIHQQRHRTGPHRRGSGFIVLNAPRTDAGVC